MHSPITDFFISFTTHEIFSHRPLHKFHHSWNLQSQTSSSDCTSFSFCKPDSLSTSDSSHVHWALNQKTFLNHMQKNQNHLSLSWSSWFKLCSTISTNNQLVNNEFNQLRLHLQPFVWPPESWTNLYRCCFNRTHLITLCCYEDFQHKTLSNLLRKQMLATSFRITFVALTCLTSTNFWWPWEPLEDNHNSGDTCQQIHQYVSLHSSDYSTCLCSAYKWALTHAIRCSNTMTISATIHENSSWLTCSSWRSIAYLLASDIIMRRTSKHSWRTRHNQITLITISKCRLAIMHFRSFMGLLP